MAVLVMWKLVLVIAQALLANPQLLNDFLANVKEFVDLVKQIWGDDGKNVVAQADVEASGLLVGRSGGLIELIKWLMANPETLKLILDFLRAIGVLKS
jgi:hypothetical protein